MLTPQTILANHKPALPTIGLVLCITLAATQASLAAQARTALQMIP